MFKVNRIVTGISGRKHFRSYIDMQNVKRKSRWQYMYTDLLYPMHALGRLYSVCIVYKVWNVVSLTQGGHFFKSETTQQPISPATTSLLKSVLFDITFYTNISLNTYYIKLANNINILAEWSQSMSTYFLLSLPSTYISF